MPEYRVELLAKPSPEESAKFTEREWRVEKSEQVATYGKPPIQEDQWERSHHHYVILDADDPDAATDEVAEVLGIDPEDLRGRASLA